MKMLFFILPLLFVLLFISCTMGGVEVGLVGTWNLSDIEGKYLDGATDKKGTWVINCNDTFTGKLSWKKGGNEFEITGNGTITANYQNKIINRDYEKYERKMNGIVRNTDPAVDNQDEPVSYILNNNTLKMTDDSYNATYTKQ